MGGFCSKSIYENNFDGFPKNPTSCVSDQVLTTKHVEAPPEPLLREVNFENISDSDIDDEELKNILGSSSD